MSKKSAGEDTAGITETSMALSPLVHRAHQGHAVKVRVEVFSQEPGTLSGPGIGLGKSQPHRW